MMTADELVKQNDLLPHPEGGFYKETYRSQYSTGIFYLLRKGEFSALHRIKSDEMWHFYGGESLVVVEYHPDGRLTETRLSSQKVQHVVAANTWFGAYLPEGSEFAFCGCTVAPAFEFKDFELANVDPGLPKKLAFLVRTS